MRLILGNASLSGNTSLPRSAQMALISGMSPTKLKCVNKRDINNNHYFI